MKTCTKYSVGFFCAHWWQLLTHLLISSSTWIATDNIFCHSWCCCFLTSANKCTDLGHTRWCISMFWYSLSVDRIGGIVQLSANSFVWQWRKCKTWQMQENNVSLVEYVLIRLQTAQTLKHNGYAWSVSVLTSATYTFFSVTEGHCFVLVSGYVC